MATSHIENESYDIKLT